MAPVINSFNSSRQRFILARRFLSNSGLICLRYWYVLERGDSLLGTLFWPLLFNPMVGAIFLALISQRSFKTLKLSSL